MDFEAVAAQLRKPEGEFGKKVGEKMNEGNLHMNRYVIETLNLADNYRVLEIGMGNGFFVKDLLARYPPVHYAGCDFSETMVAEARNLNQTFIQSGRAEFLVAASDNLPFPEETFDTVFTLNTIYFWAEPKNELDEIRRVLKPGGEILIALRPKSTMTALPFVQYGFRLYEKEKVEELLQENGYENVRSQEQREPDQQLNGETVRMDTLMVRGQKRK